MIGIASSSASTDSRGGAARPAVRLDGVPERAGAQAELDAAVAEQVERRGGPGQHGGRPQRQVGHVGEEADVLRLGRERREQRPGLQEARLVRVVLHADEVEPELVGAARHRDDLVALVGGGRREDAEEEVVAVVGHQPPPMRRAPWPAHSRSRSTNFCTLPVDVFGSGPNSMASGHL